MIPIDCCLLWLALTRRIGTQKEELQPANKVEIAGIVTQPVHFLSSWYLVSAKRVLLANRR